ncbi:MAG: putative bifunctional diguanylate cyclase/phosphodiesterase [bacterium]
MPDLPEMHPCVPYVLIVDDDKVIRLLARDAMESMGFRVQEAEHGAQAVAMVRECAPDLMLLDVMMPVMDGFAALREIRRLPQGKEIPVVVMTGLNDIESINKAFETEATDFAVKPVNWMILNQRIRYILRASRSFERLRTLSRIVEQSPGMILITGLDGRIEYVNPKFTEITGYTAEEVLGRNPRIFKGDNQPPLLYKTLWETITRGEEWCGELCNKKKNGESYWVSASISPIRHMNGALSHFVATEVDITERKRIESRLRHLTQIDPLTNLPNRDLFNERLSTALAQAGRNQQRVAVLLLDLDRFKTINETLGHDVGDYLLKKLADRLNASVRAGDTVARMGGDEFLLLLLQGIHRPHDVAMAVRRLLREFVTPFHYNEHEIYLDASLGISIYPDDGLDAATLLKNAHTAMYRAKENKSGYEFYKRELHDSIVNRVKLEADLRRALENNQLAVHYQPQFLIQTGGLVGAEALARWEHPADGPIPPSLFIPLAEETRFIGPITEFVLHSVCAHMMENRNRQLPPVRYAVNISAIHFMQDKFLSLVNKILKKTGADPHFLEFELTESLLLNKSGTVIATLTRLKEMGIRLSIDDFGTGYSSLSYIHSLPFDGLKIDCCFIKDLSTNPQNYNLTRSIIVMAHGLGLQVTAEGVEVQTQLDLLKELDCDMAQGYFLGRPMPENEFVHRFGKNNPIPV